MRETGDWRQMNEELADLLKRWTGAGAVEWLGRIQAVGIADRAAPRAWLTEQVGVGYAQDMDL